MIETIKKALESVPALSHKVKPHGLSLENIRPPLAAYTVTGPDPYRSLSGKVHHYSLVLTADILAKTFDECQAIYAEAIDALGAITGGNNILRLECSSTDADAYVAEFDMMRKQLVISVDWR